MIMNVELAGAYRAHGATIRSKENLGLEGEYEYKCICIHIQPPTCAPVDGRTKFLSSGGTKRTFLHLQTVAQLPEKRGSFISVLFPSDLSPHVGGKAEAQNKRSVGHRYAFLF